MASSLRVRGDRFDLRYRRNEGSSARLGLIIPKRLARRAVLRNVLKRLARESFRQVLADLPAMDVVLRLAKTPLPPGSSDLRTLRGAWRKEMDSLLAGLPR
jgi:ribonuclease P protein component